MNYKKIYDSLMKKSDGRTKSQDYYEKHHVIPKCLGGTDEKHNLVLLTAEEHWIAHLLLVKMNPGVSKLVYACQAMSMTGKNTPGRTTNKMFGWIRREYADSVSKRQRGRLLSVETRDKISKTLKGRLPEHQKESNVSQRPEVARKISESKKGKSSGPFSTERKENIRKSKLGKPNAFMQNNNPNKIRVTCLACNKETTLPVFNKVHLKH